MTELPRLATSPYPCVYTRWVFCHDSLPGMPFWLTSRGDDHHQALGRGPAPVGDVVPVDVHVLELVVGLDPLQRQVRALQDVGFQSRMLVMVAALATTDPAVMSGVGVSVCPSILLSPYA